MYQIVLFIHVLLALTLVTLVLIQQGKGAAMGAAFGAGASQTVFGSQGSGSFLLKVTTTIAICFFGTSISLGYIASHEYKQSQVLNAPSVKQTQTAPASAPAQQPAQQPAKKTKK